MLELNFERRCNKIRKRFSFTFPMYQRFKIGNSVWTQTFQFFTTTIKTNVLKPWWPWLSMGATRLSG